MSAYSDDDSNRGASRGDAYDYLVSIYQDDSFEPALRFQAARAALPYERAPLRGAAPVAAAQETEAQAARKAELLASICATAASLQKREEALAERERRLQDGAPPDPSVSLGLPRQNGDDDQ